VPKGATPEDLPAEKLIEIGKAAAAAPKQTRPRAQKLVAAGPKEKPTPEPGAKHIVADDGGANAHAKAKPLVVEMFIGTCTVKNPLPGWRVINDVHRDNDQAIMCERCESYTRGGQPFGSSDAWFYECRCKESHRDAALERKRRS
jgi:hypothetical protein